MSRQDNWLVHEHSLYENLLGLCRDAVETEDWGSADRGMHELVAHLKRHMALEEGVLYPAYEAAPEAPQGPTTALRDEHDGIVRLIRDTLRLMKSRDSYAVLEALVQLENLMIKHHEKEEDIFLPMASHILHSSRDELLRQMAGFDTSRSERDWDI